MKKFLSAYFILIPVLLAGCESGSVQNTLGLNREAPDEFTVVSRPPLTVPPEFTLRPPRPGEAPRGTTAEERAKSLLTGQPATTANDPTKLEAPTVETAVTPVTSNDALSASASSLLKKAGADSADTNIREKLTVDANTPVDNSDADSLLDQIVGKEKREPVVDAKKEAERLRDNKDEGKPLNEGEVPVEKTGEESLIDRIF